MDQRKDNNSHIVLPHSSWKLFDVYQYGYDGSLTNNGLELWPTNPYNGSGYSCDDSLTIMGWIYGLRILTMGQAIAVMAHLQIMGWIYCLSILTMDQI